AARVRPPPARPAARAARIRPPPARPAARAARHPPPRPPAKHRLAHAFCTPHTDCSPCAAPEVDVRPEQAATQAGPASPGWRSSSVDGGPEAGGDGGQPAVRADQLGTQGAEPLAVSRVLRTA